MARATKSNPQAKPRKGGKRETSNRVSSIAGRLLRYLRGVDLDTPIVILGCSLRELKAIAASCLNQDETRGRRK